MLKALGCNARERPKIPNKMSLVEVPCVDCKLRPFDAATSQRASFQLAQYMTQPNDARKELHTYPDMEFEKAG
jgi:hypothetical protein